ncbi:helix-turn-helix transcriptional regulator [uncultured Metabacillus sp.]|uniref:helix-turn-helix transcriptional regulator n=1 Tax=uncultured Metabacillus sp. TaxID=2860135 RepID=UPI0026123124|nr:helix-turn-helix transcriptional regulator [uncultured Metabacillus sp.]
MRRDWLISYRKKFNLTHQNIADSINVSRQYYGMIESGERDPSVETAKKIGNLLNFNWIIFFENKSNKTFHETSA